MMFFAFQGIVLLGKKQCYSFQLCVKGEGDATFCVSGTISVLSEG